LNDRSVCDICGSSSEAGATACAHCGVALSTQPAIVAEREPDAPLGADQPPMLLAEVGAFLSEGRLGGVRVGSSRDEVKRLAGIPADFGRGESLDDAELWLNGPVTFWFQGAHVERIGVYFTLDYPRNDAIAFDAEFPRRGDSIDRMTDLLERRGIGFERREDGSLLTSGNVAIHWYTPDRRITSLVVPPVPPRGRRR
jgi:hypothetical protein